MRIGSRVNETRTFMLRLYVATIASSPGRITFLANSFISLKTRLRLNGISDRLSMKKMMRRLSVSGISSLACCATGVGSGLPGSVVTTALSVLLPSTS